MRAGAGGPTAAWVSLLLLTFTSLGIAEARNSGVGFAFIMIIAGGKATLIALEYMGLRGLSGAWSLVMAGVVWIGVVLVLGLHFAV